MPIIITKTVIAITAAATAISSMIGGGIAGDLDQTYIMAMDYADAKIEIVVGGIAHEDMSKISYQKYGGNIGL